MRFIINEILEVKSFAFTYRLFHEDFSSLEREWREIFMKQSERKLTSRISVYKAPH